jgi:hypothetical protein
MIVLYTGYDCVKFSLREPGEEASEASNKYQYFFDKYRPTLCVWLVPGTEQGRGW